MNEKPRFSSSPARKALLDALLREEGHGAGAVQQIPRRSGGAPPPLSFAQQRLWFLDRLVPGNPFYNVDARIPIGASVSVAALHWSLNEIVRRHESLRTTFVEQDGRPVQMIAATLSVPLPVVDLRHLPAAERDAEAHRLAMEEARTPFDLARGPLIRTKLVTLDRDAHLLLLTMHHIVSDGWSMGVLSREILELYQTFAAGGTPHLPELPIQYADFAVWQREWLQGDRLETQLAYWRRQLAGLPTLPLPTDRPRPAIPTFQGAFHPVAIPRTLTERLQELGRAEGCTLFMVLLAAFKVLLSRYSGQEDIVVGAPIANRNRAEIEPLIGFFVNTLVLRTDLSGDPPFRELLARVREVTLGAYAHQDLPFEMLVEELQPERDLSRNPLFQVIFQLFNTPAGHATAGGGANLTEAVQRGNSKFDLRFDLWETAEGVRGQLEYSTDILSAETVGGMLERYLMLLEAIAGDPYRRIGELPLLTADERRRMLVDWNATAREYPAHRGVHMLFAEQARRTPEATALRFHDATLTYAELDARTDRLARRLASMGVVAEVPVGILMERSADLVVAMLGILKAGGAYVPLDPSYPPARLGAMLGDVRAPVLLTHTRHADAVPETAAIVVRMDADADLRSTLPVGSLGVKVPGDGLAYVMFTSGTTGRPRGVCVVHRAIARLVKNTDYISIGPDDVVAQLSNVSFDAATFEIWGALLNGATLVGIDRETSLSPRGLARALRDNRVSAMFITTALFNQVVAEAPEAFAGIGTLLVGGEAMDPRSTREVLRAGPPGSLANVYGPTENTTFTTHYRIEEIPEGTTRVPIGWPIANTRTYVLDPHFQPVPVGAPGELYIGGDGLARGYWESPELEALRFIPDRFSADPRARLYRTGDVARYRADGAIEFLGRTDHQVKVRGFRVELPEIETVLAQHPAVQQSVVDLDRSDAGDARIVAYVVADSRHFSPAEGGGPDEELTADERTALVGQWHTVFENVVYGAIEDQLDASEATFNIMGWNSSYTASPIPAEEMREQVDRTVERIAATHPDRVLEIGCGTGLLLFRLAPGTSRYVGTDFSPAALGFVRDVMARSPNPFGQVDLLERSAEDFEGFAPGSFDTVILNSVAQYLPSVHDLMQVVDGALRVLAPGGTIFLGDLRSYPLLETFHGSVELFRAPDALPVEELRERIQKQVQQEQELAIDPAFFTYLRELYPQISAVQVQQKRGRYQNELTRFRYDVFLRVGGPAETAPRVSWRDWSREAHTVAQVRSLLQAERPATLGFRHVPNARLRADAAARGLLAEVDADLTVGELRTLVRETSGEGVEPEDLWSIADSLPYDVCVRWSDSGGQEGEMDVLFIGRNGADLAGGMFSFAPARPPASQLGDFANNPLQGRFVRGLVPDLQRYLQERLPEYMLPAAYVLMDALPITPNGKVDRAALPRPARSRPQLERAYVAPASRVEEQLAEIWSAVLHVDEVGMQDNFFSELGGHSLLATQVISRVREVFRVEVPLRVIFETPTVESLAATIVALQAEPEGARPESGPITGSLEMVDLAELSDDEVDLLLRQMAAEESGVAPRLEP